MSVAEWADTFGIHHWEILWSSYGKLAWVGFEPSWILYMTEPCAVNKLYIQQRLEATKQTEYFTSIIT